MGKTIFNKMLILAILGVMLFSPSGVESSDIQQEFIMNKLANCKELTNDTILWKDFVLNRDPHTKDFTFNLTLKVLREVSTKFALEFTIMKCNSDGNLDSCENILNNVRIEDACKLLFKKGQIWSSFIRGFDKPLTGCPIEPGEYSLKNMNIQKNFLKVVPLRGAMFRGVVKGFDDGQLISCVQVEMKFNRKSHIG